MSGTRGPRSKQLPLWRDAMRFLVEVEQVVRAFPRYHKYTLGHELRTQAMTVCKLVARAAQSDEQRQRLQLLDTLVWQIDDLKMSIQLAKEVEAFASFAQFQRMAEQSVGLGKQGGGWRKQARSAVQAASGPGAARRLRGGMKRRTLAWAFPAAANVSFFVFPTPPRRTQPNNPQAKSKLLMAIPCRKQGVAPCAH